jgi:uncharacterized membrane protein YeaQ/YmgE (transglycosylase-associated protein family)
MLLVGILGWIVVGLIVGFLASKAVNLRGDDPRMGIGAAVGGAIFAALLYTVISGAAITAWNPWSLLFAAVGAVVGVVAWHVVRSRTISHDRQTSRSSY